MARRRLIEDVTLFLPGPLSPPKENFSVMSTSLRKLKPLRASIGDETFTCYVRGLVTADEVRWGNPKHKVNETALAWFATTNAASIIAPHILCPIGKCLVRPEAAPVNQRYVRVVTLDRKKLPQAVVWMMTEFGDDPFPPELLTNDREMYAYCDDPDRKVHDAKLTMMRLAFR